MKNIGIIGLGLIGGSLAKSIRKQGLFENIFGSDLNSEHCQLALDLGLVDSILDLDELIAKSDTIVIAVPVDTAPTLAVEVLNKTENQTVFDVGSTKKAIIGTLKGHPKRANFVATHPMAGTEFSGPNAAIDNLFEDKICIICDRESSDPRKVEQLIEIYSAIGSGVTFMEAEQHDVSAAYVSHISHISSFALALTVLNKEKNQKNITTLASGGFRSTVRLAKSNQDTWEAIFSQNKENVLEVIDDYIENMILFKHAIKSGNSEVVKTLIKQANQVKKVL